MKYFYCRVSTREQNLERQKEAAEKYSPDEIICDKASGKNFDRPEYEKLKAKLVAGDEFYVKELDRLGRNKDMVKRELAWFKDHGIIFRCPEIPTTMIDFGDQTWVSEMVMNILVEVLGSIAEQERLKIKKRQREGIDAMPVVGGKKVSLKTGRASGRPLVNPDFEKFSELKKAGLSTRECCKRLGISKTAWYNKAKAV